MFNSRIKDGLLDAVKYENNEAFANVVYWNSSLSRQDQSFQATVRMLLRRRHTDQNRFALQFLASRSVSAHDASEERTLRQQICFNFYIRDRYVELPKLIELGLENLSVVTIQLELEQNPWENP